jgi:NADPH:quinone reductase-like Zn-dependent oxidoreductase
VAFRLTPSVPPKDDEVTIEIHAAALNFRDVMISLGLLPEKSYEGTSCHVVRAVVDGWDSLVV